MNVDLAIFVITAWIRGEITDLTRDNMFALIKIGEDKIVADYFAGRAGN